MALSGGRLRGGLEHILHGVLNVSVIMLLDVLGAPFKTASRLDFECTDASTQLSGRYLSRSGGLEGSHSAKYWVLG